eukprot:Em0005g1655a
MAAVQSLGFLGAGRIANALVRGFLSANVLPQKSIYASARSKGSLDEIGKLGINVTHDNREVVRNCKVVWITVKPHGVCSVLREVAPFVTKDHVFVSAAAGISLTNMEKNLPHETKVFRTMPNTPVSVCSGVTIYAPGTMVTEKDEEALDAMLSSVGISMKMEEHYMDIITGLTGCGPTYMYMTLDALADGGVYAGIPKHLAVKLMAHTMIGAANMVLKNGQHPVELKDEVCSPAGTSIQAVRLMEKAGYRGILMDAVHIASKRTAELARLSNGEEDDVVKKWDH